MASRRAASWETTWRAAGAADVPVGEVVEELDEGADGLLEVVCVHGGDDVAGEAVGGGDDPAVEGVVGGGGGIGVGGGGPVVDVGVGDEKGVGVPPGDEEVAEGVDDAVFGEAEVFGADDGGVDHVEAEGVGAVGVEDVGGVGVVLEALGHLASVGGEDEAVDDDVLVGGLVEEGGAEEHECVEPAARLIKAFGDEISGEERRRGLRSSRVLGSWFLVLGSWFLRLKLRTENRGLRTWRGASLAHVVLLGVRHGAGLEPAVEDFWGAVVGLAVLADDDLVDEVLVEVRDLLS